MTNIPGSSSNTQPLLPYTWTVSLTLWYIKPTPFKHLFYLQFCLMVPRLSLDSSVKNDTTLFPQAYDAWHRTAWVCLFVSGGWGGMGGTGVGG